MSAIFFLIGCSVMLALIFLVAFFWANKSGQHEDTYTPAVRILFDDELREEGEDVSHDGKAGRGVKADGADRDGAGRDGAVRDGAVRDGAGRECAENQKENEKES